MAIYCARSRVRVVGRAGWIAVFDEPQSLIAEPSIQPATLSSATVTNTHATAPQRWQKHQTQPRERPLHRESGNSPTPPVKVFVFEGDKLADDLGSNHLVSEPEACISGERPNRVRVGRQTARCFSYRMAVFPRGAMLGVLFCVRIRSRTSKYLFVLRLIYEG